MAHLHNDLRGAHVATGVARYTNLHGDFVGVVNQALVKKILHNAAHTVSTHSRIRAIGVLNLHAHTVAVRGPDSEHSVATHTPVPIAHGAHVFGTQCISPGAPIENDETAGQLHDRLAQLGAELVVRHMQEILSGTLQPMDQDDAAATYAGKIRKRDASINWSDSAAEISRKVRAYNPLPGAIFKCGDETIKCFGAREVVAEGAAAGTVVTVGKEGIDVACGKGVLRLTEVQRPGRRRISAREFAAQSNLTGKRLGWLS
jgi:hypothetical protein